MNGDVAVTSTGAPAEASAVEAPFKRVICGIDGSRSGHEAARQAAALVASGGSLELVAVADEWGTGLAGAAVLSKTHARRALDTAAREIKGCPASVATRIVTGRPPWELLIREASGRDLLVVARHTHSRFSGPMIGSTAANLVHRAHLPVLIAVAPPDDLPFPGRILVAADGPGHPERAIRLGGLLARQASTDITLVRLEWSHRNRRPELADAIGELAEIGIDPTEILAGGLPRRQIPAIARSEKASLIVLGSRGLTGARALSSISERVAHDAPCSSLIVRPPAPDR